MEHIVMENKLLRVYLKIRFYKLIIVISLFMMFVSVIVSIWIFFNRHWLDSSFKKADEAMLYGSQQSLYNITNNGDDNICFSLRLLSNDKLLFKNKLESFTDNLFCTTLNNGDNDFYINNNENIKQFTFEYTPQVRYEKYNNNSYSGGVIALKNSDILVGNYAIIDMSTWKYTNAGRILPIQGFPKMENNVKIESQLQNFVSSYLRWIEAKRGTPTTLMEKADMKNQFFILNKNESKGWRTNISQTFNYIFLNNNSSNNITMRTLGTGGSTHIGILFGVLYLVLQPLCWQC